LIDPIDAYCAALKDEFDRIPAWSQEKDKLQRLGWNNGCAWVEKPVAEGSGANWGEPQRQPPASYVFPGTPDDRQPPEY
jgi:hypothetical protein